MYLIPLVKSANHGLPLNPERGGLGISFDGTGGECCDTAAMIETGKATIASPQLRGLGMIVPDGVARVAVELSAAGNPTSPAVVVSGSVLNNVAAFRLPRGISNDSGDQILWYARTGQLIKKFLRSVPRPTQDGGEKLGD